MRYLLDTNVLSHAARAPRGIVANRIRQIGGSAVYTSIIVACEIRFGTLKRGSGRVSAQVEAVLGAIHVAAVESPADAVYGRLRWELGGKVRQSAPTTSSWRLRP